MTEVDIATFIFKHLESVTATSILVLLVLALSTGKLWSQKAVQRIIDDCEYHRVGHERVLGELERSITVNKVLASKIP